MTQTILIVDDEADIRNILKDILEDEGYNVITAAHSEEAFQCIAEQKPSLAILDIWLENSDRDGMEILDVIVSDYNDINVLMISGHGNIETAVKAIQAGAYDFIEKPFKIDRLIHTVERALLAGKIVAENRHLKIKVNAQSHQLDGKSNAVMALLKTIDHLADSNSRVMISGPRGAGKSSIAALLKEKSTKNYSYFTTIDCGSLIPDDIKNWANNPDGLVILDHVQNMSLQCQSALNSLFRDSASLPRLISILDRAFDGTFSPYLSQQLSVEGIIVPDLSQRIEDIPDLVKYFVKRACHHHSIPEVTIDPSFIQAVIACEWPGNIGQLKLACEWSVEMVLNHSTSVLLSDHLPQNGASPSQNDAHFSDMQLKEAREQFERQYLQKHYRSLSGNITKMAEIVGMDRTSLHRKIKSLELKSITTETEVPE